MERKSFIVFLALVSSLLFLPRDAQEVSKQEIIVSAAISLKTPLEKIRRLFEQKHTGVRVSLNFGASGDLRRQVEVGAPVDVFVPASLQEMEKLESNGKIIRDTRNICASNTLVLISPFPQEISLKTFSDLKRETVKRIAISNPETVPAGGYAKEILRYFSLFDIIKNKLVFAENAIQVLDYVARGEVDAGIVYLTDALLCLKKVRIIQQAPERSHTPALYPIAVIRETKNEAASREFTTFVTSDTAQKIFKSYGFRTINGEKLPE
jgi:molybdate transport system substrate-binding protein